MNLLPIIPDDMRERIEKEKRMRAWVELAGSFINLWPFVLVTIVTVLGAASCFFGALFQ
jgi:hypothetical protein